MDFPFSPQKRLAQALLHFALPLSLAGAPLPKTPTPKAQDAFVQSTCAALSQNLSPDQAAAVRRACACGPSETTLRAKRKLFEKSLSLPAFVVAWNARESSPFTLRIEGVDLVMRYPRCYCPCIKHLSVPAPSLWCQCTVGYTEKLFSYVLQKPVSASLDCSIAGGAPYCDIRIHSIL